MWDAFLDPVASTAIIPSDWLQRYEADQKRARPIWTWEHMVIDYIAGMTDAFAEKIYNELYGLKVGSIYDLISAASRCVVALIMVQLPPANEPAFYSIGS